MHIIIIQRLIHETAKNKGWWDSSRSVGDCIALMHSELSEALEEHRNGNDRIRIINDKPEGLPIELADVIIRILDFAECFDINMEEAIKLKMDYNESRPYRHGGKVL